MSTFTLRFPFQVAPGQTIGALGSPLERHFAGLRFRLEHVPPVYAISVTGFPSEDAGRSYATDLWAALKWVQLERQMSFNAERTFATVTYADDPEAAARNLEKTMKLQYAGPIDGLVESASPAVYPSAKRLMFIGVGTPTVEMEYDGRIVLDLTLEGMAIRDGLGVPLTPEFETALDLHAAYWFEHTARARLLTLVLALECLLTHPPRHVLVRSLIDSWGPEAETLRDKHHADSEEYYALDSLIRELMFRKSDSLRKQVHALVGTVLKSAGDPLASDLAARAVAIYDSRSTLVHKGHLPQPELRDAIRDGKTILERVLSALYRGITVHPG